MSEANNFLNKLRMADSATKRRWLVGLSFAAALIVVFAWGQYFNSLVLPPSAVQGGVPDQGQTFTFGQTLRAGLGVIWERVLASFHNLGTMLFSPKSYPVTPASQ